MAESRRQERTRTCHRETNRNSVFDSDSVVLNFIGFVLKSKLAETGLGVFPQFVSHMQY